MTLTWTRGAGGIISTTRDMTAWEQALHHERPLPRHRQGELRSLVSSKTGGPIKHTTPSDLQGFGLGIARMTHPEMRRFWFCEGETLAFRALNVYLPRSRVIFALALNSQLTVDHIGDLVVSVYGPLVARGVIRPSSLTREAHSLARGSDAAPPQPPVPVLPALGRWSVSRVELARSRSDASALLTVGNGH